jgi:uncharacterized membrane protein
MEPSTPATQAEERELDRVGAFSDGVFAIAITLLVLNLDVPHVADRDLGKALSDLGPDFVAYGIGFAVIGLFWYGHHKLFARLGRSSGRLVVVNMAFLALIGLMPFTTAVLGRYNEPVAVALYATNVGIAMLVDGLLGIVALRQRLYAAGAAPRRSERATIVWSVSHALVFFVSIPLAYAVSESFAKWFWLALILIGRFDAASTRASRARSAT